MVLRHLDRPVRHLDLAVEPRKNSLEQDKTGAAVHTFKMRFHSGYGIFVFAFTLTGAAISG
jgi:hypothetical protein